jgi:ribokinase
VAAIAVVGSANIDLVTHSPRRPGPGETIMGISYSEHVGGKGVNQALAAARLAATSFVGCLGIDAAAITIREVLTNNGLGASQLQASTLPTGRAFITVTPDGENSILVIAGANTALTPEHTLHALDISDPSVVLTQLETPLSVASASAHWAYTNQRRFVLNASPAAEIPRDLLAVADPLIVNETEARQLLHTDAAGDGLANALVALCRSAIITLGARGAVLADTSGLEHFTTPQVVARDTTGAGDTFAGTFAAHLAQGHPPRHAIIDAVRAASLVVATPRSTR